MLFPFCNLAGRLFVVLSHFSARLLALQSSSHRSGLSCTLDNSISSKHRLKTRPLQISVPFQANFTFSSNKNRFRVYHLTAHFPLSIPNSISICARHFHGRHFLSPLVKNDSLDFWRPVIGSDRHSPPAPLQITTEFPSPSNPTIIPRIYIFEHFQGHSERKSLQAQKILIHTNSAT